MDINVSLTWIASSLILKEPEPTYRLRQLIPITDWFTGSVWIFSNLRQTTKVRRKSLLERSYIDLLIIWGNYILKQIKLYIWDLSSVHLEYLKKRLLFKHSEEIFRNTNLLVTSLPIYTSLFNLLFIFHVVISLIKKKIRLFIYVETKQNSMMKIQKICCIMS